MEAMKVIVFAFRVVRDTLPANGTAAGADLGTSSPFVAFSGVWWA